MAYTELVPHYGDLFTVETFRACCLERAFIDYDGFGHSVLRSPEKGDLMDETVWVKPSRLDHIPADATHIVWFNR